MSPRALSRLVERAIAARASDNPAASPCASICRMNPSTSFCVGCLRTLDEISAWSRLGEAEKRSVWRAIELRAAAGFGDASETP